MIFVMIIFPEKNVANSIQDIIYQRCTCQVMRQGHEEIYLLIIIGIQYTCY